MYVLYSMYYCVVKAGKRRDNRVGRERPRGHAREREREREVSMAVQIYDSNRARAKWRDVLDLATAGTADVVIERYGKPVAVVIAYDDYTMVQDELDDQRAARRAAAIYEEWKRDPSLARPYTEFRAGLVEKGTLNEQEPASLENTGQPSG